MDEHTTESLIDLPARRRSRGRLALAAGWMRVAAGLRLVEPEVRGLHELVRPGDVCFDVGAAYGMYSVPLADLVGPIGAVHSFEPQGRPRAILGAVRTALGAAHIRVSESGLGRTAGHLELRLPVRFGLPISGHAHLAGGLVATTGRAVPTRRTRVAVTTVDEVVLERGIERVHFIKADVEGFEPEVLHGAAGVLARDMPTLLLEIEDRHLARYGRTAAEVSAMLRERGYAMSTWRDGSWQPAERVELGRRNYLFRAAAA
ncbi:FkbM family methyltransferase [Agrococcus baldri]|uniref:Methyltransferase n=1 Tax=Agrococcus baldri TaxID=153730 RepID=A0AA87R8K0_9MICO|nr:FkbM family methyltransferase [Agrococcus baldri]GEK78664.1 putative methyltransferase [Agrococcus baldri]